MAAMSCISNSPSARRSRGASARPWRQASAGSRKRRARRRWRRRPSVRRRPWPAKAARVLPPPGQRSRGFRRARTSNEMSCSPDASSLRNGKRDICSPGMHWRRWRLDVSAPGHGFNQGRFRRFARRKRRPALAVSQNRDAVGDGEHLVETVRDVDNSALATLEARR